MKCAKWILVALVLVLVAAGLSVSAGAAPYADENCGANATWKIENNTLIISGTGPVTSSPWYTYHRYNFDKVVISDGITALPGQAFLHCTALRQVTIPVSVLSVGADAFTGCNYLQSVTYGGTLTQWKKIAFQDTSGPLFLTLLNCTDSTYHLCGPNIQWVLDKNGTLNITGAGPMSDFSGTAPAPWHSYYDSIQSVVIEEGITSIGSFAFYNLDPVAPFAFNRINIPKSVSSIGSLAFSDCTQLTDVYYGGTSSDWKKIQVDANNEMLTSVRLYATDKTIAMCGQGTQWQLESDGTLIISGEGPTSDWSGYTRPPWHQYRFELKKVIVQPGVTHVGRHAFDGSTFTEAILADSVQSIGNYAFDSARVEKIHVGKGLIRIYEGAFDNCEDLQSITLPDTVTNIGRFAFRNCEELESVHFGSGVEVLADSAFFGCTSLKEIVLPNSITDIGELTFYNCKSLTRVVLPNGLKSIGEGAFESCSALTRIQLPDGITTVGYNAFRKCSQLTELNIPASLVAFHEDAVYECSLFSAFRVDSRNPNYASDSSGVLYNKNKSLLIRAPEMLTGNYQIPSSVTNISWRAFRECKNLTHVTIPDGITQLPSEVFYLCEKLESITLSQNLTRIGAHAFWGCKSLCRVELPKSLTLIDSYAFGGCKSLKTIFLPDSITAIGIYAFAYCESLENFSWPRGVTTISASAFDCCFSLLEVNIPDTVTSIGEYAFYHCSKLQRVTVPASVTEIGYGAFNDCSSLTDLQVASGNPSFATDSRGVLFSADRKTLLQAPGGLSGNYQIPNGTTTIKSLAFLRCAGLTQLSIPTSVTTIESNAIFGNETLEMIRVAEDNPLYSSDASGVLFNKDQSVLIMAPNHLSGSYQVPETVTRIGNEAFRFTEITQIHIPDSVTEIGWAAFAIDNLTKAYYIGTKEQWRQVTVAEENSKLTKVLIFCGSAQSYDMNYDGKLDTKDAIYLLLHTMFGENFYPLHGMSADVDGNGKINQNDAVYLLLHTMFGNSFYPLNITSA